MKNFKKFTAFLIMIMVLMLLGCATFNTQDPWTRNQKILQGTSMALQTLDWGTTLDIVDREGYYETNPIIGKYPSKGRINLYFICSMAGKFLLAHYLPSNLRKYWFGSNILISSYMVNNNYGIGLRVNF